MKRRLVIFAAAMAVLASVVALPALATPPSSPPGLDKADVEKTPITISGTVESSTDEDGQTVYTLTHEGTTYELGAGPPWFFGDNHPLESYVGSFVTIDGETAVGSSDVDVDAIDGAALREPGPPPWAGGPWRVGEGHPGWSAERAEFFKAKFGDCFPPGHCKQPGSDDEAEPEAE